MLSNYRMHKLSDRVEHSIESIYTDRFMVQDLLFSYHSLLDGMQKTPGEEKYMELAADLRSNYFKTALTSEESRLIKKFSADVESQVMNKGGYSADKIMELKFMLFELEKIQMDEAQKQMSIIRQTRSSEELGYYLETTILILLLLLAQLLISTDNWRARVKMKPHRLN